MPAKKRRRKRPGAQPTQAVPAEPEQRRQTKEEARRRREAIVRAVRRRRVARRAGWALAATGLVGLIAWYAIHQTAVNREHAAERQQLSARASAAAKAAGCTDVRTVPPYAGDDQEHTSTLPPLTSYQTQPPTSGPHGYSPLDAGVFSSPPNLGAAIHSLEHGAAIVWYSPSAIGPDLDRLRTVMKGAPYVIVAPYQYGGAGGTLQSGKQMVMVAWHRMQSCTDVSAAAAVGFTDRFAYDPSDTSRYEGEAPERGAAI